MERAEDNPFVDDDADADADADDSCRRDEEDEDIMESRCVSSPESMYEKISASRCGCVGKPLEGATRSSFRTRREPKCWKVGSEYWAKEKVW